MLEHGGVQLIDELGLNLLEVWSVVLELGDQIVENVQNVHPKIFFGVRRIQHVATVRRADRQLTVQAFDVGHCVWPDEDPDD